MKTLTKLSQFNTSLKQLKELQGERICQNHFGDYLIKEIETDRIKYRIWLSHTENVKLGQKKWQIEANGIFNGYTWQIVSEGNK